MSNRLGWTERLPVTFAILSLWNRYLIIRYIEQKYHQKATFGNFQTYLLNLVMGELGKLCDLLFVVVVFVVLVWFSRFLLSNIVCRLPSDDQSSIFITLQRMSIWGQFGKYYWQKTFHRDESVFGLSNPLFSAHSSVFVSWDISGTLKDWEMPNIVAFLSNFLYPTHFTTKKLITEQSTILLLGQFVFLSSFFW